MQQKGETKTRFTVCRSVRLNLTSSWEDFSEALKIHKNIMKLDISEEEKRDLLIEEVKKVKADYQV